MGLNFRKDLHVGLVGPHAGQAGAPLQQVQREAPVALTPGPGETGLDQSEQQIGGQDGQHQPESAGHPASPVTCPLGPRLGLVGEVSGGPSHWLR